MAHDIQISVLRRTVGHLHFLESAADLASGGIRRTADGYILAMPMRLTLDWQQQPQTGWQPLVTNLSAVVCVDDGSAVEIGTAQSRDCHTPTQGPPKLFSLELRGSLEALNVLEKRRNGGPPKLFVSLQGEVAPCFYAAGQPNHPPAIRGVPERIYSDQHISYPQDAWVRLMEGISLNGNVLVEMPVRADFPGEWREIYGLLSEAKRHLARGGSEGWNGCVFAVRKALEAWAKLEKEDQGAGWKAPTREEREARTKRQRADAVRWHLLQFAHDAAHSPADKWTRDDGILALTTLAALLAQRDP